MVPIRQELKLPPAYFVRRLYAVAGVYPLGLFLVFQSVLAAMLLFGSTAMIQTIVSVQSHPAILVLQFCFMTLPLLFHFVFGLTMTTAGQFNLFQFPYRGNFRYVIQRVASVVFLLFLVYHGYQVFQLLRGDLTGYQFIKDILFAHQNTIGAALYWTGMMFGALYFSLYLWSYMIDWGYTPFSMSQKMSGYLCGLAFVVLAAVYVFFMVIQIFPSVWQ